MKRDTWMNEVRFLVIGIVLVAASAALAGWEGSLTPCLYNAVFASYATGEAMTDKGVTGGTWGDVAAHAHTAAETNGLAVMCMSMSSDSHGIPFSVARTGVPGPKNVYVRLSPGSISKLPTFEPNTVKASFFVYLPYGSTTPTFQGWTADGWKTLTTTEVACSTNAWYDVSMWIVRTFENKIQVQYRLKKPTIVPVDPEEGVAEAQYVALSDEDGTTWFNAGVQDETTVTSVTLRGAGTFEHMTGKELPSPGVSVSFQ